MRLPKKQQRKLVRGEDYRCWTPATWLVVRRAPELTSPEVTRVERGGFVKVFGTRRGRGGTWAKVGVGGAFGWAPMRNGGHTILRPGLQEVAVVDELESIEPARSVLEDEGFYVPPGLLEGRLDEVPLIVRAVFRYMVPLSPDEKPLSVVVATRLGSLVTIVYAITQEDEQYKGLLRILISTLMAEECEASDTVVVLSTKPAIPVWAALGFVRNPERDTVTCGALPIKDDGAVCMEWPARRPRLSPDDCWRKAKFRRKSF